MQLKRNARLRKEYMYRKSLEGKQQEEFEKKRQIRQALAGMFRREFVDLLSE
tara:strand:+ start:769 stop:924 length:156 start_codon:yes stop_codon:yes gene_type:complete